MKNLILIGIVSFLTVACGSDTPFQRGAKATAKAGRGDGFNKTKNLSLDEMTFKSLVHPALVKDCDSCHSQAKFNDFESTLKYVTIGSSATSLIYLKATGLNHRAEWSKDSPEAKMLSSWINTTIEINTPDEAELSPEPSEPAPVPAPNPEPVPTPTEPAPTLAPSQPTTPPALDQTYFDSALIPILERDCNSCHNNPAENFETAKQKVVLGSPDTSLLYLKATGADMGTRRRHRATWSVDSVEAAVLISWINGSKL